MNKKDSHKRVLFYRRLLRPDAGTNGGNLKLRDSYDHFVASDNWDPLIHFSPDTVWQAGSTNLWTDLKPTGLPAFEPEQADLLFFSGHDWLSLSPQARAKPPVPILNIVQPRHVRAEDKRQSFLQHPAIRIAKSEYGADILRKHGVNGPLYVIPDAIDLSALPPVPATKDIDVLIPGLKQPDFAREVYQKLTSWNDAEGLALNIQVQLPPKLATRYEFLSLVSRAKIIACVPLDMQRGGEGFYLPALEAMALRTLVVCPHAIGNVDHCLDGINCLVPEFTVDGLVEGVKKMLGLSEAEQTDMRRSGLQTANEHDLAHERKSILDLANRAHEIWLQDELFLPSAPEEAQGGLFQKLIGRLRGSYE
jgi:glycosyltransferase involved in cell wall biosynthesis